MNALIPGLLVLASLLALAALAVARAARWRAGRAAAVDAVAGLLAMPGRYLHDVHDAVLRDPVGRAKAGDTGRAAARMHMLTAGGFIAATALILAVHLFALGGVVLAWLLLAFLALMSAGLLRLYARRKPEVSPRLSRGGFDRLPYAFTAFIVFFAIATLPAAGLIAPFSWASLGGLALLALGAWACIELYVGMGYGPLKHALNGVLHLAFHPRPARFGATTPDSALQPLPATAERLGVEQPRDFAWNRLLAFDACVQCGRCEAACPAFAAGLPLNPKKLIQDLVAASGTHGSDLGYSGSPYPQRPVGSAHGAIDKPIIGSGAMIHPDTLWACTTCRACVYECPMMIEHVDAVVDLRRFQTLELGATPNKAPAVLEELKATDTVCGRPTSARLDWAADLRLPLLAEVEHTEALLWIGEGGFDMRNQRTLRALVKLLREAGIEPAVLGAEELDCGDVARRLGDEKTFEALARRNIATLNGYAGRFARIVTADPHVLQVLGREYPSLGGHYSVVHHSTLLAELIEAGRLKPAADDSGRRVTFHDPCYLGRYNGEVSAPRRVLKGIGIKVVEMNRSGMRSSCCGWGGGSTFTDVPGKRRIPDVRMDHVRETGAELVAVACPNCAVMLEGVVQPRADVADLAELLLAAVEAGK